MYFASHASQGPEEAIFFPFYQSGLVTKKSQKCLLFKNGGKVCQMYSFPVRDVSILHIYFRLQSIYASAGMAGPQFTEPYATTKLPALTSGRTSATKSLHREPVIHVSDPHDIALKVSVL